MSAEIIRSPLKARRGSVLPPISTRTGSNAFLLEYDGNIGRIAKALGVGSRRLRKFIAMSTRLSEAVDEVFEGAVDEAVGVLFEGLRDEGSHQTRFYAAKEFLRTGSARRRGFGQEASGQATLELKDKGGARTITLRWLEPRRGIRRNRRMVKVSERERLAIKGVMDALAKTVEVNSEKEAGRPSIWRRRWSPTPWVRR